MNLDLIGVFKDAYPLLFKGVSMTIEITVLSILVALVIGIITCLFNMSHIAPLRWIAKFYIWLIRGTPMLVQGMYIYFAVPQLVQALWLPQFRITVFTASFVTLTLNAGAYLSEIFRGAIQAVNKGQMEAARSLGLSYGKSMRKIILPQAVQICLPSLVNQFIITLKDSTILYAIGLPELMYCGKQYVGRTFDSFATYTIIAIFFLIIISILMLVSSQIERRMKK
jgi:His/Glu/Gln/Arg/opine family amino acid ABC transporter permease subunit